MRLGKSHLKWNNVTDLAKAYEDIFGDSVINQGKYSDNEQDKYSFELRAGVYVCVDMYDMTKDILWLERAKVFIDKVLDNTDVRRVEKGDIQILPLEDPIKPDMYYQSPYPTQVNGTPCYGWSSYNATSEASGNLRNQVLIDGQILGFLGEFADYILSNNLTDYASYANSLLDYITLVIDQHEPSWREDKVKGDVFVKGSYFYPNRDGIDAVFSTPLAYNHEGEFFHAAMVVHKYRNRQDYLDKIYDWLTFLRDYRTDMGDRYVWKYHETSGDAAEDLNHGAYYLVPTLLYAYDNNFLDITEEEMTKYTNSILYSWREGKVGQASERVDGTSADETLGIPEAEKFSIGQMAMLGRFNSDFYLMSRDLISSVFIDNFFPALWAYSCFLRYAPPHLR